VSRDYGQLYPVAMAVMRPAFNFAWRYDVTGIENLPQNGGAIMAPNHTSVIDSFFLPAVLPRRITYIGKAEYLDDWKTKHLFPALGMIPVDRKGGNAAAAALDAAAGVLDDGELFGIYPEGTRSRSGNLHKGHTGVSRLSMRTGAPVIPVGLVGIREVQPPDQPLPNPFMTVGINLGNPLSHGAHADGDDPRVHRAFADRLMYEISQLSGQTYVNEYANKKQSASAAGEAPLTPRRSSADVLAGAT